LSSQPNSHKATLLLLAANANNAIASSVNCYFVFQYNPEKLLHTFNQNPAAQNTTPNQQGEFFSLTFELDSVDFDNATHAQTASQFGIHPALAMLEAMMQPQKVGSQTIQPIVVFNWGAKRSVAVRIVNLCVEEQSFDASLNPTRATVNLTLKVLEASEVGGSTGAKNVCETHSTTLASLVNVYKVQTGQGGAGASAGAAAGVSGSSMVAAMGSVADASNLKSADAKVRAVKTVRSIKSR